MKKKPMRGINYERVDKVRRYKIFKNKVFTVKSGSHITRFSADCIENDMGDNFPSVFLPTVQTIDVPPEPIKTLGKKGNLFGI